MSLVGISPLIERATLVAAVAGVVWLVVTHRWASARAEPRSLAVRHEIAWLVAIVAVASLTRLAWYDAPDVPRFAVAHTTPLWVARWLEDGDLGRQLVRLFRIVHVGWVHDSVIMMPVAAAFQLVLGPSLHLPVLVGAFWGVLAVVLAWGLGRSLRTPTFGLLFAAFLAASPLQITWSRLGGLQAGASAYLLLVIWVGWLAGRRRSLVLTAVAAAVTWASVYHYYALRIALPLGGLALLAGLRAAATPVRAALGLVAAFLLAMGGLYAATAAVALGPDPLWPRYGGYVGSRGEGTLAEVVANAVTAIGNEGPRAARAYFWQGRAFNYLPQAVTGAPQRTVLDRGMVSGGLVLLPVGVLGLLGLLVALRHCQRDVLWLAAAGLGFLVPCFSTTTARRLLLFDTAWCALAAGGTLALLGACPLVGRVSPRAALVLLLGLNAYAFATIMALGRELPPYHSAVIPFAESGFGDARTCIGCYEAGLAWQKEIADGAFVVLIDSDVVRENSTNPGGLNLYGKVAALAVARPEHFVEYYGVWAPSNGHPAPRGLEDASRIDFTDEVARRATEARPARILWEFVEPTQWERALADRLEAAGGTRRTLPFPPLMPARPHSSPGIEISTPANRQGEALARVREFARSTRDAGPCLRLEEVGTQSLTLRPVTLAAVGPASAASPPRWAAASLYDADLEGPLAVPEVIALAAAEDAGDAARLWLLNWRGYAVWAGPAPGAPSAPIPVAEAPIGLDCAARVDGAWWIVDALTGRLSTAVAPSWALPAGRWIGVARGGPTELILASADQTLLALDTRDGRVLRRFPAVVPPSQRFSFGECPPIVAGDGWVGTFDYVRGRLAIYDREGRPLGGLDLQRLLPPGTDRIVSVAAAGSYLGLGLGDNRITTFRVERVPDCDAARGTPPPAGP